MSEFPGPHIRVDKFSTDDVYRVEGMLSDPALHDIPADVLRAYRVFPRTCVDDESKPMTKAQRERFLDALHEDYPPMLFVDQSVRLDAGYPKCYRDFVIMTGTFGTLTAPKTWGIFYQGERLYSAPLPTCPETKSNYLALTVSFVI